jgi:hypothetical protein
MEMTTVTSLDARIDYLWSLLQDCYRDPDAEPWRVEVEALEQRRSDAVTAHHAAFDEAAP